MKTSDVVTELMVIDLMFWLLSQTVRSHRFLGPLKRLVGGGTTVESEVGHWKAVSKKVDAMSTRSSSNSTDASSMSKKSYSKTVGVVEVPDGGLMVLLGLRIASNS